MRSGLQNAWKKASHKMLLSQPSGRFTWLLVTFVDLLSISMSLLLTLGCWIWWKSDVPLSNGIVLATTSLLVHSAMTYETGYKKTFCEGRRRYFYLVWVVPIMLSLIGFIGGLFYRGML